MLRNWTTKCIQIQQYLQSANPQSPLLYQKSAKKARKKKLKTFPPSFSSSSISFKLLLLLKNFSLFISKISLLPFHFFPFWWWWWLLWQIFSDELLIKLIYITWHKQSTEIDEDFHGCGWKTEEMKREEEKNWCDSEKKKEFFFFEASITLT